MATTVPVKLGRLSSTDTLGVALHNAAAAGDVKAIKKALASGLSVDYPNDQGQTPLFLACVGGHYNAVKTLLEHGGNPNEKSADGVTPVHVAAYVGDLNIFGKLMEGGGDLRLHDVNGQKPKDWATLQPNTKKRVKMLEYIDKIHLFAMTQSGREISHKAYDGIPGKRMSLIQMIKEKIGSTTAVDTLQKYGSMGFGRVYTTGATAGIISIIPLVSENSLLTEDMAPTYYCGRFFVMQGCRWNDSAVTVKRLEEKKSQPGGYVDLLIQELEMTGRVRHPNFLLLMGICQTTSLDEIMLIFERVTVGSIYHCLHERRDKMNAKMVMDVCMQVCDGMVYLHDQNLIHCGISSHAIHFVNTATVKIANLEYAIESEKADMGKPSTALKAQQPSPLLNWMAPELIRDEEASFSSDIYSFACVVWEMLSGKVPWRDLAPDQIKHMVGVEGNSLPLKLEGLQPPLDEILEKGLAFKPKHRVGSFQTFATKLRARDSQEMDVSDEDPGANNNHPGHMQELDPGTGASAYGQPERRRNRVTVRSSAKERLTCSGGEDTAADVWQSSYRLNRNVQYDLKGEFEDGTFTYKVRSTATTPTEDPHVEILSPRQEDIRYYTKGHSRSKSAQTIPRKSGSGTRQHQRQQHQKQPLQQRSMSHTPRTLNKFSYLYMQDQRAEQEGIKPASHLMEARRPCAQLSTAGTLFSLLNESSLQSGDRPERSEKSATPLWERAGHPAMEKPVEPSAPPEFSTIDFYSSEPSSLDNSPEREDSDSRLYIRQGSVKNLVSQFEHQVQLHESGQAVLEGRRSPDMFGENELSTSWPSYAGRRGCHSNPESEIELPPYEHTFLYPRLNIPDDSFASSGSGGTRHTSMRSTEDSQTLTPESISTCTEGWECCWQGRPTLRPVRH